MPNMCARSVPSPLSPGKASFMVGGSESLNWPIIGIGNVTGQMKARHQQLARCFEMFESSTRQGRGRKNCQAGSSMQHERKAQGRASKEGRYKDSKGTRKCCKNPCCSSSSSVPPIPPIFSHTPCHLSLPLLPLLPAPHPASSASPSSPPPLSLPACHTSFSPCQGLSLPLLSSLCHKRARQAKSSLLSSPEHI